MSIEELSRIAPAHKADFVRRRLELAGLDPDDLLERCTFALHPQTGHLELAVSGGADSVALLVIGFLFNPNIRIWHLDHQLRPTSKKEAESVKILGDAFGVTTEVFQARVDAGPNLEERARELRRSIFIGGIATGHTMDDLCETMIINLIRGAGVHGLGSISAGPEHPILDLRRSDTEAVCNAMSYRFVLDESNVDTRFVRNRIRHEVIPLLSDVSKRDVVPILARTAHIMQQVSSYISSQADKIDPTDAKEVASADEIVATEALRRWLTDERGHSLSFELAKDVLRVAKGEKVATDLPGSIRVRRSKGKLSKFKIM